MFRFFFPLLFLFYSAGNSLTAQKPVVKSFDIRSESTRPRIAKLLLDKNGLIWAGTDNGVFTFDGINFTSVVEIDSLQSPVSAMFEDKSGRVWLGYENGRILCLKNNVVNPFNPEEGLPKVAISGICEDTEGKIYFSTKGEGVYCMEKKRLYNIDINDGLSSNFCYTLLTGLNNEICVGTDAGINLVKVSNGKKIIKVIGTSEGLPDDVVRTFTKGNKNSLWFGMQDNGVALFDYATGKVTQEEIYKNWKYGQINSILIVEDKLWIATAEYGIKVIDRSGNISSVYLESEKNIKASHLLIDLENNVWIAEAIHLHRTAGEKLMIISQLGNKPFHFIHCITSDKYGNIWFSPDQQIGCLTKESSGKYSYKEFTVLKRENKIDIVTMYFDDYGYLWFGTMGEGLFRFNPGNGKVRKILTGNDFERSSILSINGSKDSVWVVGFNSVMLLRIVSNGKNENATIESSVPFTDRKLLNDYVYSVFIDSKKQVWFGTDEHGVFKYDGRQLINYPTQRKAVHSFTEDKKGRIWFTTVDAGLKFFDTDDSLKSFLTRDGLSDPSPTSLQLTNGGKIIIMHANGFDVLNPDDKSIFYHSVEENLTDIHPDLNSITQTADHKIWMGTEKGIIIYNPEADVKKKQPSLVLQSVSIFLEPIDFLSKNEFAADENNIQFNYDGIWYTDPQRVNYRFILEGYSTKWENTKDHSVIFPKLPHGNYRFRIQASLNSNFLYPDEVSYAFVIHPYIWQRWWFRIIISSLLVFVIILLIRRRDIRVRKLDRLQKEKIQFQFETLRSQVNPHFLFNSFNTLISVIENTPGKAVEFVERLSEFFRNIITYKDVNLITVDEELNLLDNYIFIQKKRFGDNLELQIDIPEAVRKGYYLPPLTMQLLAENAIKHNAVSRESRLTIRIVSEHGRLEISNNINPKISKETSTGMGLQNIANRYELLTDKKIEILMEPNKFSVTIPLLILSNENSNS